jgi:hypothetical protein
VVPLGLEHVKGEGSSGGSRLLSRRQLLVRGLVATGGILIGGVLVRYGTVFVGDPGPGRLALTEGEERIARALLDTLFPEGADMPRADPDFVLPKLDHFLAHTDSEARFLFRAMLHVIEDHALISHFKRFTSCSLEERAAEIAVWERTPLYLKSMAFKSVKLFIGIAYFEQPDVRKALGWYIGCAPAHLEAAERDGVG